MLEEIIRNKMVCAMKDKNIDAKNVYSMLLDKLVSARKEKKTELDTEEENAVVMKFNKQIQEEISTANGRQDIITKAKKEEFYISEFLPQMMSEKEINNTIDSILIELNITIPNKKDKGNIMKLLMPRVKGKADGKLVNQLLSNRFLN